MEQQEINNEINPPHPDESHSQQNLPSNQKQFTQLHAQKRLKQLHRHMYTNFPPYQKYFHLKQHHLTLHKSIQKQHIQANFYEKQRLCLERQAMYYRGAVDEYLDNDVLKEFIEQSSKEKGYVGKIGNKSIIKDGVLIYGNQSRVKAMQLPLMVNPNQIQVYQQSVQPMLIEDFGLGNTILELEALENHRLNSLYQGTILKIRFSRQIIIYSVKQRKNITNLQSPTEFLHVDHSLYAKNTLQTIEFDGLNTIVSTYFLDNKQDTYKSTFKESFNIFGLINSKINLNRNQIICTKYHGLYSIDRRTAKQTQLYHVANQKKDKIYTSIPLKANYHFSPLILNCHSRFISLFDIRKPNQLLKTFHHQCQESPPFLMNFYDGSTSSLLEQPVVTCHSPYSLGSSLLLSLGSELFEDLNTLQKPQSYQEKQPLYSKFFTLLHDNSKSTNENGAHRYFNESLSLWNESSNQFSIFQVDNQGSIGLQTFKYDQKNQKYLSRTFHSQNEAFLKQKHLNPSENWLEQTMIQKYFIKQTIYEESMPVQIESLPEPKNKKKNSKKTKSKSKSKAQKKIQELKEPQTQVDLEDFFDGQYQNSSECPEALSRRKVNFADLSQFYLKLQEKARNPKMTQQSKPQNLEFSLSTQANSQSFNASLQLEPGIKALSFHNKKLMNYWILQKMRSEWDN